MQLITLVNCPHLFSFRIRLTVTDNKRQVQGAAIVERTGGDLLAIESEYITFNTTSSYINVSIHSTSREPITSL